MPTPRKCIFYRAEGKSLAIVKRFHAKWKTQRDAQGVITNELGATRAITHGERLTGFVFEAGAPDPPNPALRSKEMLVSKDGETVSIDVWVPNRRRKAGRELLERMQAAKAPGTFDLTHDLLGEQFFMEGRQIRTCSIDSFADGDVYVIGVPLQAKTEPPGAVLMRTSDYWRLREERDDRATEAAAPA